jgi:hypothetical protein
VRRLIGRPPVSDLFGIKDRAWLRALEEAETVAACLRYVEFLPEAMCGRVGHALH